MQKAREIVDIVSGLVDTHSYANAHTHTHYYKTSLTFMFQVLARACSEIASCQGPLRKGLACIACICTDIVSCISIVTGHEQCIHSSICRCVWFLWGYLVHACACNANPDLDTKPHWIERKCTQYITNVDTGTSEKGCSSTCCSYST